MAKSKDCCQFRSAMFLATPLDLPADRPCAVQRLDEGQRGGPATNQEAGGPALLADRHVRTAYVRQVRLISDVQLFTRRGNDWTNHFRKIAADAWHISAGSVIIDGEIVVPAVDGTPNSVEKVRRLCSLWHRSPSDNILEFVVQTLRLGP